MIDGLPVKKGLEAAWDPIFSPDGKKILLRGIEDGKYFREVLPLK